MVSYKFLENEPTTRIFFRQRITTLQGLQQALLKPSALFALDTEHIALEDERHRALLQVGAAHLPTMTNTSFPSNPKLADFHIDNQSRTLVLNINIDASVPSNVIRLRGKVPYRGSCRFGAEEQVNLSNLEPTLLRFIHSCEPKTSMILVGYGMAAEWTYMFHHFPGIMSYFSAWVDLRDVAKDIAPVGVIPGLELLLQILGYKFMDIGRGPQGTADNAGNGCVMTLAVAHALLHGEYQEKLRLRQRCGQIARIYTLKKGFQNLDRSRFSATIQCDTGGVPKAIDTNMKLAREFLAFSPLLAGWTASDTAVVTFESHELLDHFIRAVDQRVMPTGEALFVQTPDAEAQRQADARTMAAREAKQRLRRQVRIERSNFEMGDIGDMFPGFDI